MPYILFSCLFFYNRYTLVQSMLFTNKMRPHLHAIMSSSWDPFHQFKTFLQKTQQQLRSRSMPAYLAMAAFLTILASLLLLSLGRIKYHWDSRTWDVGTTKPQDIVVPSSPRGMAANNTLGVRLPTLEMGDCFQITIMRSQLTFNSSRNYSSYPRLPAGVHAGWKRRRNSQTSRLRPPSSHPLPKSSSLPSWGLAPKKASTRTEAQRWHG